MSSQSPTPEPEAAVKTTKAYTYTHLGPYRSTLHLTPSHPLAPFPPTNRPDTSEEWLLLRVAHAALNPADLVALSCMPFRFLRSTRTAVPAMDFTATVVDVWRPTPTSDTTADTGDAATAAVEGEGVGGFQKGDRVVCFPPLSHMLKTGVGGLQQTLALPARYAVLLPPPPSPGAEAAGLLLAGCTAEVMVEECGIERGQRVLVVGAGGGVGSMVVQLVREKVGGEGWVVGVCGGGKEGVGRGVGADEVIDYTAHPSLPSHLTALYTTTPFDHILDTYGSQPLYLSSSRYLSPSGIYCAVTIHYASYTLWELLKSVRTLASNALWPRSPWLGGTGRTFKAASMMDPGRERMERLVRMWGEGRLRVVVDSEWGFGEVHEALDALRGGHATGKVVVRVGEEGDEEEE